MKHRNGGIRTLMLMIAAALFVVLSVILLAFFSTRDNTRTGITLPMPGEYPGQHEGDPEDADFMTVTADNAAQVVLAMSRPAAYRQTITQNTTVDSISARQTTDLWVRGKVWKIVTTDSTQVRHILTDGETAYIWYWDDVSQVRTVSLPGDVTPDDLAGILTYETIGGLSPEEITAAEYTVLDEQNGAQCLYVATENASGIQTRFWVNLNTGLLCKASCLMEETEIYNVAQTRLVELEDDDSTLAEQMLLPDGTDPFLTAAEETQPE